MNYINPNIIIKESKAFGKGVFVKSDLEANTLIEISPVIVLSENDTKIIHQTLLHDYYFLWGDEQVKSAIALGYVSLYNHAQTPNCIHECNFKENTISIYTKSDIKANEELYIDYNMGLDKELWFEVK